MKTLLRLCCLSLAPLIGLILIASLNVFADSSATEDSSVTVKPIVEFNDPSNILPSKKS